MKIQPILEKLLEEVDTDIKEFMLADSEVRRAIGSGFWPNWGLVEDPIDLVIKWQQMRNSKK